MMRLAAYAFGASLAALALMLALTGCTALMPLLNTFADNAKCIVAKQNLPTEQALKECAVRPENVDRIIEILSAAREESALQANRAAAVQAEKDQRAGVCK